MDSNPRSVDSLLESQVPKKGQPNQKPAPCRPLPPDQPGPLPAPVPVPSRMPGSSPEWRRRRKWRVSVDDWQGTGRVMCIRSSSLCAVIPSLGSKAPSPDVTNGRHPAPVWSQLCFGPLRVKLVLHPHFQIVQDRDWGRGWPLCSNHWGQEVAEMTYLRP